MIFNTLLKRTIGAGGMDGILEVDHLPQPPQEATPDELWMVMEGQVIDFVLFALLEGERLVSFTIIDDHTAVSSPESLSDDVSTIPLYCDSTDAWIYIREGHPAVPGLIPAAGWLSGSQMFGLPYNGIVDTKPTADMNIGVYAVRGQEAVEGDHIEKDSVYKATTYKDVTTLYAVKDGAVINVTELKANEGVEVEIETLWYNDPSNIPNPIATTNTKMHIYFLLDCHLWAYDGTEWTDWGMTEYGLTHTNAVITEPPTADMTEGFYTLNSRILDNIHFGITFANSEVSRFVESETCAVYVIVEGIMLEFLSYMAMMGLTCLGYKVIKNQSEFDMPDMDYAYVNKTTNTMNYYLFGNWQTLPLTVLASNEPIPSTDGYYCYYKVEQKWENPYSEIADLKEKLIKTDAAMNFMKYAELTGVENGITLSDISNTNISIIEIPPYVTEIGHDAFDGCDALTTVTCSGDSQLRISSSAFYYCENLTTLIIPDSLIYLDYLAFSGCDKLQYNIYDTGKYIGSENNPYVALSTFVDYDAKSCVVNERCSVIGSQAFYGCSVTSLTIPTSVRYLNRNFLWGSDITDITYLGTIAQWNSIIRESDLNDRTVEVHCTDGDITIV